VREDNGGVPMMRWLLALLILAAGLGAAAALGSVAEVDSAIRAAGDHLHNAVTALAADDRPGAAAELDLALADADAGLAALDAADTRAELGRDAARAEGALRAFRAQIERARKPVADANVRALKAAKSVAVAAKKGLQALRSLRRIPLAGFLVEERDARSAGFHSPNRPLTIRITAGIDPVSGGTCDETPFIRIVDTTNAGAILPPNPAIAPLGAIDPSLLARDRNGRYLLPVQMGPGGGAGRVEVTACGRTRSWLLFNYGNRGFFPEPPRTTLATYDGHYEGTFSGSVVSFDANGDRHESFYQDVIKADLANGTITVTEPFNGKGTVTLAGRVTGNGDLNGDPVTFRGQANLVNGRMVVTGTYDFNGSFGTGSGHFRFER
jgi:hypothetical protein